MEPQDPPGTDEDAHDEHKIDPKLREWVLDQNPPFRPPVGDTFVVVGCCRTQRQPLRSPNGGADEFHGVRSFVIPTAFREQALARGFKYGDFNDDTGFEEHGVFDLGDFREDDGVPLERLVRRRTFDGWGTSYYEPSDRFAVCQRLHRVSHELWHDPLDREAIVKGETWPYLDEKHTEWEGALIKIRQAELRDYLAARRAGLLLVRFFERTVHAEVSLSGLPEKFENDVDGGTFSWWFGDALGHMYGARIEDTFWIPPAERTRWHGGMKDEEAPIPFTLRDGTRVTYEDSRYWEPITFHLDAMKGLASKPGCSFEMCDLTQATMRLRDGACLQGVVTQQGQFQVMFVDVHRNLNMKQQEQVAALCEIPKQERIYSDDWIKVSIKGEFPVSRPVAWTIKEAIGEINEHWRARCGQTLLEDPKEGLLAGMLGATGPTMDSFVAEMLELRKAILPEHNPKKIKAELDLEALAVNKTAYQEMKSINVIRLVLQRFLEDDKESLVLGCINDARNTKSHPKGKTIAQVLEQYDLSENSPRAAYLMVLARLLAFLGTFRAATELALDVSIGDDSRRIEDDPWRQLEPTVRYLVECVRALDPPPPTSFPDLG